MYFIANASNKAFICQTFFIPQQTLKMKRTRFKAIFQQKVKYK